MYSQTRSQFGGSHWHGAQWSPMQWRFLLEVIDGATPRVGLLGEFWAAVEVVGVFDVVVGLEGSWS